jgi:hypothetical protein
VLVIRKEQMVVFEQFAIGNFARRAAQHLQESLPDECTDMGSAALMQTVRAGVRRALAYGLEQELDVLRFLNLMFLLDFNFDTDPRYAWATELLRDTEIAPSARMAVVYDAAEAMLSRED